MPGPNAITIGAGGGYPITVGANGNDTIAGFIHSAQGGGTGGRNSIDHKHLVEMVDLEVDHFLEMVARKSGGSGCTVFTSPIHLLDKVIGGGHAPPHGLLRGNNGGGAGGAGSPLASSNGGGMVVMVKETEYYRPWSRI